VITIIDWEIFKGVAFDMMEGPGPGPGSTSWPWRRCAKATGQGVVIEGKSGREAILAKTVIDTTGDGTWPRNPARNSSSSTTTKVGMPFGMTNVDMPRCEFLEEKDMSINHPTDKGSSVDDIIRLGFELKRFRSSRIHGSVRHMGPPRSPSTKNNYKYINGTSISKSTRRTGGRSPRRNRAPQAR
jgi:hypothetical protein